MGASLKWSRKKENKPRDKKFNKAFDSVLPKNFNIYLTYNEQFFLSNILLTVMKRLQYIDYFLLLVL